MTTEKKKKKKEKKPRAPMPIQEGSVQAEAPDKVPAGVLQPIAASILMQMLYGARYARPDLLRAITLLARKMTKWRPMQDIQLHRLVCYMKASLHHRQYAWVGDSMEDVRLHLYTDADLASDPEDSVSTSGAYFALVGPHTHVPLGHRSKRQTAVSHSSTESELVSADHGLKAIGLPALDLWEVLLQRRSQDLGLLMFQDNDACCRICRSGKIPIWLTLEEPTEFRLHGSMSNFKQLMSRCTEPTVSSWPLTSSQKHSRTPREGCMGK